MKITSAILSLIIFFSLPSCGQNFSNRIVSGKEYAVAETRKALNDKYYKPFYDTLIKVKKTAIEIAEPILFNIYGKKNITEERPYECYLIDGYWYISGTLPKGYAGGVFEIILNSKNAQVIKLIHGK